MEDPLAIAEKRLRETQRKYDEMSGALKAMLDLPATPENMQRLQEAVDSGQWIEKKLHADKREVERLRGQPAAPGSSGPSLETRKDLIKAELQRHAREGNRGQHRLAFARFMKILALQKGNPAVADRLDQTVLAMPGVRGLEAEVWKGLRDPAYAAKLDAILSR